LCPVCKVVHVGRCPRLPSVALAELKRELSRPAQMAATLTSFVDQVFASSDLMKGGPGLADRLYDLYSSNTSPSSPSDSAQWKPFFEQVNAAVGPRIAATGGLQNYGVSLSAVLRKASIPEGWAYDFLYFQAFRGAIVCRLYMNVAVRNIPEALNLICQYAAQNPTHGVVHFKTAGPAAAPGRKDSIVVYCQSQEAAKKLGESFLPKYAGLFQAGAPGMTTGLGPFGLALGAEPVWQATGMSRATDPSKQKQQSFGTIRTELIAMAIENYNENKTMVGSGAEMFKRFVCVAFRGYGLDPMNPGN
jgi:hypothetical protein